LVSLDQGDLVGALAASTELPLEMAVLDESCPVNETWTMWQAGGRYHQSLGINPKNPARMAMLVGVLLNQLQTTDGTITLTVAYGRRTAPGPLGSVAVRVSHPDAATTQGLARQVAHCVRQLGGTSRLLNGNQGLALLHTSVMAGQSIL
jgi:hypothetical protein